MQPIRYHRDVATYLLKTEPDDYSYADLENEGRSAWDGVSNNAALMHMRRVRSGDECLIYHTGKERRIAGLARVVCEPYEDPERPGQTAKGETRFPLFDIAPVRPATSDATLAMIKGDPRFEDFALVRQARLSVMPVPPEIDAALREMAGL